MAADNIMSYLDDTPYSVVRSYHGHIRSVLE